MAYLRFQEDVSGMTAGRRGVSAVFLTLLFTGFIAATYGFGVYLFPAR
jgi:hypothetical protein